MKSLEQKLWDVVVIGGGPAGMMAAGVAAERGKSVLLLEKNSDLGRKLLITGGGRCNVTNNKSDIRELVDMFKNQPRQLFTLFSKYSVGDTLDFFNSRGMDTKEENEGRIFPISDSAQSVWDVMLQFMKENKVDIRTNRSVQNISKSRDIFEIKIDKDIIKSRKCIVATGGKSRPDTGSTGDGFRWMKKLGHQVNSENFALVPIATKEKWVEDVSGVKFDDIKISIFQDNKKQDEKIGKILFTHFGISGPSVLNLSSRVGELLKYGEVEVSLDFKYEMDNIELKKYLDEVLESNSNKKIKNTLSQVIPSSLVNVILKIAKVDTDKFNNVITREERKRILKQIKSLTLNIQGLLGADKAIVSSGGVDIGEVNFETMESKIIPGLYLVGDMLDIDRPSGGYSLQICWSSGYIAGKSC